jgi:hypothetical protein
MADSDDAAAKAATRHSSTEKSGFAHHGFDCMIHG